MEAWLCERGVEDRLSAGRQALEYAAQRALGGQEVPADAYWRLHHASRLTEREMPTVAARYSWRLPERLRLIELSLYGASTPGHQPSWQHAEYQLIMAVGRLDTLRDSWRARADELQTNRQLIACGLLAPKSFSYLDSTTDFLLATMIRLRGEVEAAGAELEASTQRLRRELESSPTAPAPPPPPVDVKSPPAATRAARIAAKVLPRRLLAGSTSVAAKQPGCWGGAGRKKF